MDGRRLRIAEPGQPAGSRHSTALNVNGAERESERGRERGRERERGGVERERPGGGRRLSVDRADLELTRLGSGLGEPGHDVLADGAYARVNRRR